MKKIVITTIVLVASISLSFSQLDENKTHPSITHFIPIIASEFDFSSYWNKNELILLNHYSISSGVQLFERLNFFANIGFINTQHLINGQNKKVQAIPLLFCTEYRFFKDFWVSPSVRFDVGGFIYSNTKNEYVNKRLEIVSYNNTSQTDYHNDFFKNWGINLSPQLLLSFKMKNLYLYIGAGYNFLSFKTYSDQFVTYSIMNNMVSGFQLKSGFMYRFKRK